MELLGAYKNGNFVTTFFSDGTKIRETEEDNFVPDFAESMDIKITDCCDIGCKFCHEGSTPNGKHGDILNAKFIDTLHPFQEVALGGGNVLSHPDLIPFLHKLKDKQVIANITVNQKHFEQNPGLINKLICKQFVYGVGVSLVSPTEKLIALAQKYPNVVIHTINGLLCHHDIEALSDKGLKLLILGYKKLRRGNDYLIECFDDIAENQKWLKDNLADIVKHFDVVSFDNLAIEQLDVRKLMTDKEWNEFYMGDDAEFTYYIDLVEGKFAKSSTALLNERYDLLDSADEMFEKVRRKS